MKYVNLAYGTLICLHKLSFFVHVNTLTKPSKHKESLKTYEGDGFCLNFD